ncbi:Miro-like protein, partial [Ostertagia ostertagi]
PIASFLVDSFQNRVFIDGLSHLLLIRDEGSASPDVQFSLWADAVIFVYSVDNQESFERIRHFYNHMNKFRNVADMPVLLVGTKVRIVFELHLNEFGLCSVLNLIYFIAACCKILQQRLRSSFGGSTRTPTPTTPAAPDKRDYQDPRYMQNVLYGAAPPPQKNAYHQRSISSAPLADQFMSSASRKSHVHQRDAIGVVSGGRFKKEVFIDGLSHLLLIRDEGSASPDVQFSLWADAVIFVYSVDNQESFERIRHFYNHMNKFRNVADMPVLLVGTKDTLSEKNPRVISEEEGKQMANHLKRCAYYETCATYGLNVERVFKDACCKILQQRLRSSFGGSTRTPTPTTPAAPDKRDYQDPRYMQNVLYGAAPPQKNAYHQRSISSAPLADQFMSSASRKSHVHQRDAIGVVSAPLADQFMSSASRKSHVHQRDAIGVVSAQRAGDRAMSAFVIPPGLSAQQQFGSRASQLDYRGVSPSNSQKSMTNGELYI